MEWVLTEDDEEQPEELMECMSNTLISERLKKFGEELGADVSKSLEDINRSHLENTSTFLCYALHVCI